MEDVLKTYKYLVSLFPYDFIASLEKDGFLYRLLADKDQRADVWRQEIDDCLELAYRYNLVDADLEARLKKGDRESWQATMNELRVAKVLEGLFGADCLLWRPKGPDKKVGEFELVKTDKPIFIEVKTVFPRDFEKLEQRVIEKLMRYAEQVPILAFLNVQIEKPGISESFSSRKFKDFLKRELSVINPHDLMYKSIRLSDYEDKNTGLYLKIENIQITPNKEERNCHIGIIGGGARALENEEYIKHSLRKAYSQLPRDEQPCLVIICPSTAFPIDEDDMLIAVFGHIAVRFYRRNDRPVTKPETIRTGDGFFQPRRNRIVSAVGLYKGRNVEKNLEIYHNPFAVNQIPDSTFMNTKDGVHQLVKANNREMKWID